MNPPQDNPGVIAPPPLIFAAFLGIGLGLDFLVFRVSTGLPAAPRYGLAAVLAVAALSLGLGALFRFRRAGTHPEPWRPTTTIVTQGAYRFTRNPMYLGMALLYAAVAVAADSVVALILIVPLLVVIRYGVIAREERYLIAKFGDEYRRYRASVRRWF
jgi:protein-S-isoprenylcysteine O-methyltransferase Ste14